MKRKIFRNEMRSTVLDLIDMNLNVAAVAFMLNKTPMAVYSHLRKAGRMDGSNIIRRPVLTIGEGAHAALRRLSSQPEWAAVSILTTRGVSAESSATKHTSKGFARKAA